jgi:hypothetical protein
MAKLSSFREVIKRISDSRAVLAGVIITGLAVISLLIGGCSNQGQDPGILEGKVTIGPIVPVERPGQTYEVPCEVYEARKIMVYDRNHDKLIKQVDIDCNGHYTVELEAGVYVVDINRIGIDSSSEVPARVEIVSGEIFRLDIDIDTGIR